MDNTDMTVSFSGHRKLEPGSQSDLFAASCTPAATTPGTAYTDILRLRVRKVIRELYDDGYRTFLCGMAEGFDLMAGEEVVRLAEEHPGVELHAIIPCPGQSRSFPEEARNVYGILVEKAARVVTVCESYRPDCFHRRNDYLTDNSSLLVCFYNGSKGGTEYTVKRALKKGMRVINVY